MQPFLKFTIFELNIFKGSTKRLIRKSVSHLNTELRHLLTLKVAKIT